MSPTAATSKAQLSYLEEVAFGVTPASAGTLLRMTGESLAYDNKRKISDEINATRQVSSSTVVSAALAGGINFELSFREFDPFLEALLAGAFTTFGTDGVKAGVAFTFAGETVTTAVADTFLGMAAGDWFSLLGAAPGTDNSKMYRIATYTSALEVIVDVATPLVGVVGADYDISHSVLANGVLALRSFQFERQLTDVTLFFTNRGCRISKLDLSFATGAPVTGVFNAIGKDAIRAGATAYTGANLVSQAYGMMNTVSGIGSILVDNATTLLGGALVKSMKIAIDAKLRGLTALAALGNIDVAEGTFDISGDLEVYLSTGALYDKALADEYVSIQFPVYDSDGNGYVFVFNNCKFELPKVPVGAKDTDIMLSVKFTAEAPATATDKMIKIYRLGVVAI